MTMSSSGLRVWAQMELSVSKSEAGLSRVQMITASVGLSLPDAAKCDLVAILPAREAANGGNMPEGADEVAENPATFLG
ncbi:MAG: hypothetical protein AMXMBFR20_04660 [Planctomycetia bacterium]